MQNTPFLELHDVVVRRSGRDILRVDSFELAEGESIALLGPNGAGKSTFIGLTTREVLPLFRENPPVRFRGNARASLEEVKQYVGIVSSSMQEQIRVHLPAIEIVIGGLFGSLGVPHFYDVSDDQRERAYAVMEQLGIADLAERDVMTLSTGQARRVLIARALINDPKVLIVDEPCTGLDPEGMYYVRKTMRDLVQHGRAMMLVTHYPEDIVPEIGRLLLIKDGVIFDDGKKTDMLTSERMTSLFDVPLKVVEDEGFYTLVSKY